MDNIERLKEADEACDAWFKEEYSDETQTDWLTKKHTPLVADHMVGHYLCKKDIVVLANRVYNRK